MDWCNRDVCRAITIAAGVEVAYVGFASIDVGLGAYAKIIYYNG